MTRMGLALRNLRFHGRANLAVLAGVWAAAAVLAGALIVGDSLRVSLAERSLRQLGPVVAALTAPRLFRAEVTAALPGRVRAAFVVTASARRRDESGATPTRLGGVTVYGVDGTFWEGFNADPADLGPPSARGALVSSAVARTLGVKAGDRVDLVIAAAGGAAPRSSFLGRRDAASATDRLRVDVRAVLPDAHPGSVFDTAAGPRPPLNVFVPLAYLQERLDQPGRVNALFADGASAAELSGALSATLTAEDWGLKVHVPRRRQSYVSVESRSLVLSPREVEAVTAAAGALGAASRTTSVYLANRIAVAPVSPDAAMLVAGGLVADQFAEIPYSIVAGLDALAPPPLGPLPGLKGGPMADDEVVLTDWRARELGATPGAAVTLTWFAPDIEAGARERAERLRLRAIVPIEQAAADPDLAPEFPGITDKADIGGWDPPFPFFGGRVQKADEDFWKRHRTTPKAYVSEATAARLFGGRFGHVTSVRVAPTAALDPPALADALARDLPRRLDPEAGGFAFVPVRERLLAASAGGTDFGMLFTAFSFFLIASALLLVALLVRLNLDRRASEFGVLLASGFSAGQLRRLLLVEYGAVVLLGALLGLAGAVLYGRAMLHLFTSVWPNGDVATFLRPAVRPGALASGFAGTVVMAMLAVLWSLRTMARVPARDLVAGRTPEDVAASQPARPGRGRWLIAGSLVGALAALAGSPFAPPGEMRAMAFFACGACLLTAGLAALGRWLRQEPDEPAVSVAQLGRRAASRRPSRSLLTAGLLASASFLIVSVESFRRSPERDFLNPSGGSGGFALLAELSVPAYQDPGSAEGRAELLDGVRLAYQEGGTNDAEARLRSDEVLLASATFAPLRVRGGDDASCLNLYQAARPRVLAVPDDLIDRGGFRFSATEGGGDNPWLLLRETRADGAVPVLVEENTALWQLKTGLGGTVTVPDGEGRPVACRIVGLLKDSVFQSELVTSRAAFARLYPRDEGFTAFLASAPAGEAGALAALLRLGTDRLGGVVTPTRDRLAAYLAVQNSYLTTFQVLGGFGLLLGAVGLAAALARGVWERRGEFALLRALGFRGTDLRRLAFAENALLLAAGLLIGLGGAAGAVAPHLAGGNALPWGRLGIILGGVLAAGLLAIRFAVASAAKVPVLEGLRRG